MANKKADQPATTPAADPNAPKPVSAEVLMRAWKTHHDAETTARTEKATIETTIAKRLATKGKGATCTMPDGKRYRTRVYGGEIKGPMRGKTILVEVGSSADVALD